MGRATSNDAVQTAMAGSDGELLPVVRMRLHFEEPIEAALYDYFHPMVTAESAALATSI